MALMEKINKKSDAQAQAIVENRKLVVEKIKRFEEQVTEELRNATQFLDLNAYDQDIERIANDVTDFFS